MYVELTSENKNKLGLYALTSKNYKPDDAQSYEKYVMYNHMM